MSDQRTHRWESGRLISTSLREFWQAPGSLDAADPSIPNLPLETAAAPPAGSAEGYPAQHRQRAYRRDTTSRRLVTLPILHLTQPAVASTDSALAEPFRTKVTRSRRQLAAGWMAGMAAQAAEPTVIPYPSWAQPAQARRKATERRILATPALHWQYIAPTIAAILLKPTAKVIEFRRTLLKPQPLEFRPPPTGPPPESFPAWAARAALRVSQDRRLQAQASQASYPATPAPPAVDFAAIAPARSRRRKSSGMGFVSVPVAVEVPAPPTTTPAEHPAHTPHGYRFRRSIDRRLLVALEAPVYPVTPVSESADRSLVAYFALKWLPKRRHLTAIQAPVYPQAATPPTAQGYPAYELVAANRVSRKVRIQSAPTVPAGLHRVEAFPAYLAKAALRRKATQYTRALVADAPDTPQTPAVPEQPPTAFRLKLARYTPPQHRAHIAPLLVPEWPESPPIADDADTGGVWWVEFEHYRRRKERDRRELERRREEAKRIADETAREIARLLHEQELKDAEAADLRRIRDLADRAQALRGSGQLSAVIERRLSLLAMETTRSALQALERELLEQIEQDEISALILILNDYETD